MEIVRVLKIHAAVYVCMLKKAQIKHEEEENMHSKACVIVLFFTYPPRV